ncbi:hypothetical protein AUG19_04335 [archaeon 13_1_20CM_2_54_9]|nr:MAG: hypothetical protein AUJ07_09010 [Crenarchaeota archaeon 13_1_40CM_3_53_5]OLE75762.1 MAG: hypothetical protein AUG19_04335 [archaeon 13_1_20CM_2_54_9]
MTEETEGRFNSITSGLSRENLAARFRAIRKTIGEVPRATLLHYTILALILAIAAVIRLLPLRWGPYISEFDPYFNYNDMRQITTHGWQAWYGYTDTKAWWPFGRAPADTSYPGTSFTGALVYQFLTSIGINITLYDTAVYTPVMLGVFAVLVTYFFARDLWGRSAGLLAALFLAFNASLISRTDLGFFRNEGVGIPTMVLSFLFFIRAIQPNRTLKATVVYSMLSSLSLIYMAFSWGSFRYAAEVLALFTLALIVLRRYTPKLMLTYGITMGFFLYTGTQLPLLGRSFLTEGTTLALVAIMGFLIVNEVAKLAPTPRGRLTVTGITIAAAAIIGFFMIQTGLLSLNSLGAKFLTTVNPFLRQNIPLVASVAENRPSTWASFYLELGSLTLLAVFGFFFTFQRLREGDILLIIFGITAFYFAASLVRLTLILAPAISTLAAITVVELGKPAMDIIQQSVIFPRRKIRFGTRVSREYSLAILAIILILVLPTFISAVQSAYTPVTIASSSLPVRAGVDDWLQALTWMNNNLPTTSVVFAWWDYGYWISVNTGLHTLADNGTGNLTQIQNIATGFLLNESLAVHLLQRFGVTHVAIFVSYNRGPIQGSCGNPSTVAFCGYGEDSKWFWMSRIGNGTALQSPWGPATVSFKQATDSNGVPVYHRIITVAGKSDDQVITTNLGSTTSPNPFPASNTVLGLLMRSGYPGGIPNSPPDLDNHNPFFFNKVFSSSNSYVLVYSVKYPTAPRLTLELSPNVVKKNTSANSTIQGTLATSTGTPIITAASAVNNPIRLEYSTTNGTSWAPLTVTNSTSPDGAFSYKWISVPNANTVWVRAVWGGDRSLLSDLIVTAPVRLTET